MQAQLINTLVTADLTEAARLLREGELVIFPTETVYGLGADALNPQAVAGIFEAKRRPADNPLIVHIYDFKQVETLTHSIPAYGWKLIKHFFPGGLTLLLPKRELIPAITTAGSPYVCVRMPSLPITQAFLRECGVPVAAPSANISGRPSPTRWEDCVDDMKGRVAAILQGPEATHGLESTIVDCTGSSPVLMRPGSVTLEALRAVVPDIEPKPAHNAPLTPGMKYRHYAPQATVKLIYIAKGVQTIYTSQGGAGDFNNNKVAFIGLNKPEFNPAYCVIANSVEEYARKLFTFFRECDRRGITTILVQAVEEQGLGLALMNRLHKAATATD